MAARKALQLFGDELKVRRADERGSQNSENNRSRNGSRKQYSPRSTDCDNNNQAVKRWEPSEPQFNDDNCDYNSDKEAGNTSVQKPWAGGDNTGRCVNVGRNRASDDDIGGHQNSTSGHGRRNDDRPRGTRGKGDGCYPVQDDASQKSGMASSSVYMYFID